MEYTIRCETGVTILDLEGEIELSQAPQLRDILLDLVTDNVGQFVVVNLKNVIYIDSAGLSTLITAHRKAQIQGGMLVLSSPQPPVWQVFQLTRMDKVFKIFPSVTDVFVDLSQV